MILQSKTCDIPDVDTGELCERPFHRSRWAIWPFCFEHGDDWKDYSTRSEEMFQKPLEPSVWAEWLKTGELKQGGLRLG